jgi:hypothetical protein
VKHSLLAGVGTVVLFAGPVQVQSSPGFPPGLSQANQAEAQKERDIPPPAAPRRTVDLDKLRRDANELAALAQSVPSAVDRTTNGVLPKDLSDRLKRIEKLAEGLRSQIAQ